MKYWIITVTQDHLQIGIKGGFTQANHGASFNLNKINKGDFILFYSPKTSKDNGKPLQKFSAIAICEDTEPYQVKMTKIFIHGEEKYFILNQ